jgi:hypothetical protein
VQWRGVEVELYERSGSLRRRPRIVLHRCQQSSRAKLFSKLDLGLEVPLFSGVLDGLASKFGVGAWLELEAWCFDIVKSAFSYNFIYHHGPTRITRITLLIADQLRRDQTLELSRNQLFATSVRTV